MTKRLENKVVLITGTAGGQVDGGWTSKGGMTAKTGEIERLQSIVAQPA